MIAMHRLVPYLRLSLVLGVLLYASSAYAALPAYYTNDTSGATCTAAQPCGISGKIITFYVPHSAPGCATSLQGCIATSRPGLDGKAEPIPVDAVRLGKAKYATCASDPSNYGKYFNIGTVTYRSANDQQMHTVQNVVCYVHDTGGAFRGRTDKLDLATTLCPTCSEAQAAAIGRGSAVSVAGIGPSDMSSLNNGQIGIGAGQVLSQDYYCIVSIEPVIVHPVPAGTPFPSNCYNSPQGSSAASPRPIAQMTPPPMSQPATQPSIGQRISQFLFGNQSTSTAPTIPPQALLIAQPARVRLGNPVLVSWSSVGMNAQTPCVVTENGQSLAQTNAGSKILQTTLLQTGTLSFTLSCTTAAGTQLQQSASVVII